MATHENKISETKETKIQTRSKRMQYALIGVIIIIIIAGAAIVINSLPKTYTVSITLQRNGSGTSYPYQTAIFVINATNLGGSSIVGLPIAFYINGQQQSYSTYTIPAHSSILIPKNYTYLNPGNYIFKAVADPGSVLHLNGNATKASVYLNASAIQPSNVYTSVPNANIIYTETFSMPGSGLYSASLLGSIYNMSVLSRLNGPLSSILSKLYQNTYPYINFINGAHVNYLNGTKAYVAWIQGTINPIIVTALVSSFQKNVTTNKTTGFSFSPLSNTISLCYYYSGGWTKLVEFYNKSYSGTCANLLNTNYSGQESNTLISAIKNNTALTGRQAALIYLNTTPLGNLLEYDKINLTGYNMMQNKYGLFVAGIGSVRNNFSKVNSSCIGLIYSNNGVNLCSVVLPMANGQINSSYDLVRSTYLTRNYTITVYSLVAVQSLYDAHYNAAHLVERLKINDTSFAWTSPFKNSCGFNSTALSCKFGSFQSSIANITITNRNYSSITLTSINCAISNGFPTTSLNTTLAKNGTASIKTKCYTLPIPGFTLRTVYKLRLGFMYNNKNLSVNGTLNATNFGS